MPKKNTTTKPNEPIEQRAARAVAADTKKEQKIAEFLSGTDMSRAEAEAFVYYSAINKIALQDFMAVKNPAKPTRRSANAS